MTQNALIIAIVAGMLVPVVTGLVTKLGAADGWKSLAALVLSAVVAVLTQISQGAALDPQPLLLAFATTFGASIATYHGVYKPTLGAAPLAAATARFGIGKPVLDVKEVPPNVDGAGRVIG